MQHMGWLSEELAERGVIPDMSHTELFLSRDPEKNLQADIAVEREVTQLYSSQIPELEDEELQKLVARIRDHEIYHDAVFNYLLEEVSEEAGEQEKAKAEQQEEEKKEEPPTVPDEPQAPVIPSVGSLIDKD